jgi:uncharacterized lipoprotein YajG
MIARYLAAPALLLVLVAGCDTGTTTTTTTPPATTPSTGDTNPGAPVKKADVPAPGTPSGVKPLD